MRLGLALLAAACLGIPSLRAESSSSAKPAPDRPAAAPAVNPDAVLYPRAGAPARDSAPGGSSGGFNAAAAVFIAAGALGGLWFWRRARRGGAGPLGRGERKLAIAETRPLGNRQYLVVADYEGRKFLLGVCPGRIELLSPLDSSKPSPSA